MNEMDKKGESEKQRWWRNGAGRMCLGATLPLHSKERCAGCVQVRAPRRVPEGGVGSETPLQGVALSGTTTTSALE